VAIQPIDLQTLYTQLDKVGKTQVQQQAAAQSAREVEMAQNKKEAAERLTTVQGTETSEDKSGRVHERTEPEERDREGGSKKERRDGGDQDATGDESLLPPPEIIKDPALGAHIDISG